VDVGRHAHAEVVARESDVEKAHLVPKRVAMDAERRRRASEIPDDRFTAPTMYFFSNSFFARSSEMPCERSSSMTC
jgi:hypothetical protein